MAPGTGRQLQRSRQVVWLMSPWCHDGQLGALGPPGRADFRSQGDIPRVDDDHRRAALAWREDITEAGPPSHALRSLVLGHQLGTWPPPADRVEPASPRRGGDRDPALGLPRQGPGGPPPARAAPTLGPRGGLEPGDQRPAPPQDQHGGAHGGEKPPLVVVLQAQGPRLIGAHGPIDAGARAAQDGGDLRRVASRGTSSEDMEGQQGAVPRAPECRQYLGWRLQGNLDSRLLWHRGVSSIHECMATSHV
jgi:hypothetical protein